VSSQRPQTETRRPVTFATAATKHYAELHAYLRRRLWGRTQDVEDVAQEVYLRLLGVEESRAVRDPLAYLFGIARYVVADYFAATGAAFDTEDCEREQREPSSPQLSEEAHLNLCQQIDRALAQLPNIQAAVLLLTKRDGFSYEEVAARLGITVDMVHKHFSVAVAQIRAMHWER
jgi:RNA polymerase sigma-19 factor, ECF subfamily